MQIYSIHVATVFLRIKFDSTYTLMKTAAIAESSVSAVKLYPEEYSCNMYRMLYNQDRWVYIVL